MKRSKKKRPVTYAHKETGAYEFAIDTAIWTITQLLLKARGFVILPLIVKLLGTDKYGIWSQILAFVGFSGAILHCDLHIPLIRFIAEDRRKTTEIYSTLLCTTITISCVGGMIIYLFSDLFSYLILGQKNLASYFRLSALLIIFANIRTLNLNFYRITGRLISRSIAELITTFGELLGIVVLLLYRYNLLQVFLFMAIWEGAIVFLLTWHVVSISGAKVPEKRILVSALRYTLPQFPGSFSIWALDRIDRFVIGYYLGPTGVGVYSANYAFASLLMLFQTPFQMTLVPKVAALWDADRGLAQKYISLSNKVFLTLSIPAVIGIPIIAPQVLTYLGNAEIAAGSRTITFLIAAGVTCWGISLMQLSIFYGAKRTGYVGVVTLIAALVNVMCNFLFIPHYGVSGAAFATLISYAGVCIAFAVLGRNILRLHFYGTYLVKCACAAFMMGLVLHLLAPAQPAHIVGAMIAGGLIYLIMLVSMRAFTPADYQLISSLVRRVLTRLHDMALKRHA